MKINWGTGIVIGMVAFISFIMFMVITMMTDKRYDHEMVTESYYEKDLMYQNEIDAETNANNLSAKIYTIKTPEGWVLNFPEEMENAEVNGSVQLYRPSNEKLDFQMPLKLNGTQMTIPSNQLVEGQWNITVKWEMNQTKYLYKKEMTY